MAEISTSSAGDLRNSESHQAGSQIAEAELLVNDHLAGRPATTTTRRRHDVPRLSRSVPRPAAAGTARDGDDRA